MNRTCSICSAVRESRLLRAFKRLVAFVDFVPVDDAPPCLQVFGPTVVVLQVVGVLPDVVAENRLSPWLMGLS